MIDLIGKPYRYGANGKGPDNAIDCIHLVYQVLERLQIATPAFNQNWYNASRIQIARDLLKWGDRLVDPAYDGDVTLLAQTEAAFAVTWSGGCLYINQHLKAVAWCPIDRLCHRYCFRTKNA